jgi:hypothetical protein
MLFQVVHFLKKEKKKTRADLVFGEKWREIEAELTITIPD